MAASTRRRVLGRDIGSAVEHLRHGRHRDAGLRGDGRHGDRPRRAGWLDRARRCHGASVSKVSTGVSEFRPARRHVPRPWPNTILTTASGDTYSARTESGRVPCRNFRRSEETVDGSRWPRTCVGLRSWTGRVTWPQGTIQIPDRRRSRSVRLLLRLAGRDRQRSPPGEPAHAGSLRDHPGRPFPDPSVDGGDDASGSTQANHGPIGPHERGGTSMRSRSRLGGAPGDCGDHRRGVQRKRLEPHERTHHGADRRPQRALRPARPPRSRSTGGTSRTTIRARACGRSWPTSTRPPTRTSRSTSPSSRTRRSRPS